jgi:hypothetical protein
MSDWLLVIEKQGDVGCISGHGLGGFFFILIIITNMRWPNTPPVLHCMLTVDDLQLNK